MTYRSLHIVSQRHSRQLAYWLLRHGVFEKSFQVRVLLVSETVGGEDYTVFFPGPSQRFANEREHGISRLVHFGLHYTRSGKFSQTVVLT
jgi:hypothetical protein